jgi:hypothetical protein
VTSSFDLFRMKMLPLLRETFEHVLKIGRYWPSDRVLEVCDPDTGQFLAKRSSDPMWARIILRSAAAGQGLEAATAKAAWLDECGQDEFTVETWEAVLRRLSLAQGRVLGTTTLYNMGWLKTQVYDQWQDGDPDYAWVEFQSAINPAFPAEEMERARRSMPPWRFAMQYEGRFSRPAGLIYDCFNPDVHAVEPFPVPTEWAHYVGMDYGAVNTALLWLAYDRSANRYFVYDESLEGGMSTPQHAARAREKADGRKVLSWWGGAGSEDQQRMDWQASGVRVEEPPVKDVEAGIERVYRLIKEDRLFVFKSCTGLLDELGSYRRKLDSSGQPTEVIEDKRKYHRLDALRYFAAGVVGSPVNPLAGMIITLGAKSRWANPGG